MSTETEKPKNPKIRLENVRLSFPSLFKPTAMKGGKPKYSATLLLDKKQHAAALKSLEKMIERATLDKFGKKMTFKTDNVCLHDGNEKAEKEGYGDDVMYLVAKNDSRPAVVDGKRNPVMEEDGKIYAGCYVNVVVEIYGYHHKESGSKGVSASLMAVQFVKDGPSFGGGGKVDVDKEFEEVASDVDEY